MNKLNQLKLSAKLSMLTAVALLGLVAFALVAFSTLDAVRVHGPLYQQIKDDDDLIADVLPPPVYIVESYLTALELASAADKREVASLAERLRSLRRDYEERRTYWAEHLEPGAVKSMLLGDAHPPAQQLFDVAEQDLIPAALAGDAQRAAQIASGPIKRAYAQHRSAIDRVVALARSQAELREQAAAKLVAERTSDLMLVAGIVGMLVALLAWLTVRRV